MNIDKGKKIIGFLLFMVIAVFLLIKVTWLFRGNDQAARVDLVGFKNQEKIDVVLYGGSTLLRFFSPMDAWNQEGMVAYNYATSGAKVDIVKEYIEDSRKTNEALLYVVDIRTYPMVVDTVDDLSLRNWSDSLPLFSKVRWEGISHFLFTRDWQDADIPSFYFDIIKYHSNKDAVSKESQWLFLDRSKVENLDRGFAPNISSVVLDEPKVVEDRGQLTDQQENALNDLLDYCDSENLPILFIVCPYYISGNDWKVLNACGDIIERRGYDFINFNRYYDEIGLDFETDFSDVNHVNYIGSIKYTNYLINYIKSNYDIPDRRNQIAYAQWSDDYEEFSTIEKEWYEQLSGMINSHIEAHEVGKTIGAITEFDEWYKLAQNDNYTLIINKTEDNYIETSNDSFQVFMNKIGILTREKYTGIWNGANCLFSSTSGEAAELKIGINGGRGRAQDQCNVSTDGIIIAGEDYTRRDALIQLLLYDNNYKEVIDNVCVLMDEKGEIHLVR